ncbi:MAG: hypothetical protein QXH07_05490 [Thermoplasmata archaeon]
MTNDYLTLSSEIRELESLLVVIPEGNVIDRISLQSRLESVKVAMAMLQQQTDQNTQHADVAIDLWEKESP